MKSQTRKLRILISLLTLGLASALGLLFLIVDAAASEAPELNGLRWPTFIAIACGTAPWFISVKPFTELLRLVDRGDAFSTSALQLLRQIRLLFVSTAIYLVIGFFWLTHVTGGHPALVLVLCAGEVVLWFIVALVAALEQVFAQGLAIRIDNELTV